MARVGHLTEIDIYQHTLSFPFLNDDGWHNLFQLRADSLYSLVASFIENAPPEAAGVQSEPLNLDDWLIWMYDILWALSQMRKMYVIV